MTLVFILLYKRVEVFKDRLRVLINKRT